MAKVVAGMIPASRKECRYTVEAAPNWGEREFQFVEYIQKDPNLRLY
jgi:hypothetical protein